MLLQQRFHAILFLIILWTLSLAAVAAPASAGTLYERSRALLATRTQATNPNNFCFIVMGDSRSNEKILRKALRWSAAAKPLFILHGGDIGESGKGGRDSDDEPALLRVDAGLPECAIVQGAAGPGDRPGPHY